MPIGVCVDPAFDQVDDPKYGASSDENLTQPKRMTGMEIASSMTDQQLNRLPETIRRIAKDRGGFIAARLLIGGTGGMIDTIAATDDDMPEGARLSLFALGTFMMWASVSPRVSEWAKNNDFTRRLIALHTPTKLMSSRVAEEFRKLQNAFTQSDLLAKSHELMVDRLFKTPSERRALAYVLDEATLAPELASLSKSQQSEAIALSQIYAQISRLMREGMMAKGNYGESYVRSVLPLETYQRWRTHGFTLGEAGKRVRITSLRQLEEFAKNQKLPGPLFDEMPRVVSRHLKEMYHVMGANNLGKTLMEKGVVQDLPKSGIIHPNWRKINAPGFGEKMAPEEIAQALENLNNPSASKYEVMNSLDAVKGVFMRSIMLFPWEHGLNTLRAMIVAVSSPKGFWRYYKEVKNLDPALLEDVKAGANLFDRPDFGPAAHQSWQQLMGKIGMPRVGARFDAVTYKWEKWLWDQWVPMSQHLIFSTKMAQWAEQTAGKFGKETAEYTAAARRAADFANTALGKTPGHLTSPDMARWMRLVMFSPKWTMTRMALISHAAGEVSDMLEGRLNFRDAWYVHMKMRQVALTAGLTYLISHALTGHGPEFNPNTSKFYARTGWRNAKGQEVGIDLTGWWQADLKMFNHPFDFIAGRLNPMLNVGYETITSRDYLGRDMTTGQTIENIVNSLGPIGEIPQAIGRAAAGSLTPGSALQSLSGLSATGNVATLPVPMDVALAKMAKKMLIAQGLTASNDNIWQLSRIMRANMLYGQPLVDGQVINYLAYQRRNERMKAGIGTGFDHLWQHARSVIRNLY